MAALASAGLFYGLDRGQSGAASANKPAAAVADPLRIMALRSPGERLAGVLLSKKKGRAAAVPAPPAGSAAPRLSMLRGAPPPLAPEAGVLAAPPAEPVGWLRGPPEAFFGEGPDDLWIYPPLLPPPFWPEEPLVVVGPIPPPLPPPLPPTPPPTPPTTPIPEPSTWLMLILGVFGVGAVLRRRRAAASGAAQRG